MKRKGARLGQHFLKNPYYAQELVRAAEIHEGDTVLEIGPGTGALTRELLATGGRVIAIEKDEILAEQLKTLFSKESESGQLQIISGDVRDIVPEKIGLIAGKYILAANIPYYITGEIIRQFLSADAQPKTMALLIQKEVAVRILSPKESILSISVKAYGTPRIVAKVSKGNFSPPPSVDSAILAITDISKRNFTEISEEKFFDVVRAGFSSKRKLLANNLGVRFGKEEVTRVFSREKIPTGARAETVHVEQWLALAKQLNVH